MINIKLKTMILYLITIIVYAVIYYLIGYENFSGMKENSFLDCFYFSTTTMSTVGYGDMVPIKKMSRIIVTTQQLMIILFAMTILIY